VVVVTVDDGVVCDGVVVVTVDEGVVAAQITKQVSKLH
jgi:hypothetical protein